jgi:rhodanese-related sulfurtransferase
MNIKVLPLKFWMLDDFLLDTCIKDSQFYHRLSKPIFGRPGIYLHGVKCWFETPNEEAYIYPIEKFKYDLDILEAFNINHRQLKALKDIMDQRLSTHKQRELYYLCQEANALRRAKRNLRKAMLRTISKENSNDST